MWTLARMEDSEGEVDEPQLVLGLDHIRSSLQLGVHTALPEEKMSEHMVPLCACPLYG